MTTMFRLDFRTALKAGVLGVAFAAAAATAHAETLTGAGGTAIYPVLQQWAAAYHQLKGVGMNYQAIGSGGGIKQIQSKVVPFANSDKPLTPEDLKKSGLVQFPAVIIGIAPVVHLPNVKPGELVFDGKVLAEIYLGEIKNWNDPKIRALNPHAKLPDMAITVVHRSDGSGTTFNFTNYLAKVSPDWKAKVGSDTAVSWPVGVGGKGNAGVAQYVQQVNGSIGYVEYAYVMQAKMVYARMKNVDGKVVSPSLKTFQAAAANADFGKTQDFYLILTDQPGAESWPITAATYILMRKDTPQAENKKIIDFCDWFLEKGQSYAEKLDYVPLPGRTIGLIKTYWKNELGVQP